MDRVIRPIQLFAVFSVYLSIVVAFTIHHFYWLVVVAIQMDEVLLLVINGNPTWRILFEIGELFTDPMLTKPAAIFANQAFAEELGDRFEFLVFC